MHRITLMLALGLLSLQAGARNGFYVSPSAGAGISSQKQSYFSMGRQRYSPDTRAIFSFNAGVNLGYSYRNWRIESGLQYFTTGYKYDNISLGLGMPNSTMGELKTRYQHLAVPLRLGYNIALGHGFNLIPYSGAMLIYNLGARTIADIPGELEYDRRWSSEDFKSYYNETSFWGSFALQLEYKAGERLRVFCGPAAQYMISNFLNLEGYKEYQPSERAWLAHIDLGLRFSL